MSAKLTKPILSLVFFLLATFLLPAQDKNPFQSIGKKGKIVTLTNGKYVELFDQDSIQQIGTVLVNVRQMKVVKLLKEDEAQKLLDNSTGSRFLSVDPLQVQYPELTPYQFASNRPIEAVDLDGKEAKDLYMELEPVRSHRDYEKRNGIVHPESRGERNIRYFVTFGLGIFTLPVIYFTAEAALTGVLANSVTAMNVTVNTVTWLSNTNNLLAASSTAGFVFQLVNPDPGGTYIDFPGSGDDFGRAVKMAFKTKAGKVVEFAAEKGAKFANQSEFYWAGRLLDEGNNVKVLREVNKENYENIDFLVNGIRTEIKEISDLLETSIKFGDRMKERLEKAISQVTQGGSQGNIIIDVTKQKGATKDFMTNIIDRLKGKAKEGYSYRIVGDGYELNGTVEKLKK